MSMAFLFGLIIGTIFLILGTLMHSGAYKTWYLGPHIFPPQAVVYATIPVGIAFVILAIMVLFAPNFDPDTNGFMVTFCVLPIILFGFILAIWRPRWIKPRWVNWLEDNYSDQLHILIENARQNPRAWEKQVSTQEGLEAWAKSVAGDPQPKTKV